MTVSFRYRTAGGRDRPEDSITTSWRLLRLLDMAQHRIRQPLIGIGQSIFETRPVVLADVRPGAHARNRRLLSGRTFPASSQAMRSVRKYLIVRPPGVLTKLGPRP